MHKTKYVIVTPARNEEIHIEKTITSMVSQTVLPQKWVIVSDGSTDGTDEIVQRYTSMYNWIEFVRMPSHSDRQFAAKVYAFNAGYERIKDTSYDIIGNLDADISFEKDYFEFILNKFDKNPRLGVAGTPFVEESFKGYDFRFTNIDHVSGACQLFRRECYEEIGGYIPVRAGGIDWIAVTTARMKGWQTRTFLGKTCMHHRKIGTGNSNPLVAKFKYGAKAYYLGGHPLWEALRALFHMKDKPYIIGGLFFFMGYILSSLRRIDRPISNELLSFYRHEQMARLRSILYNLNKLGKSVE
jgi:glycosyltransferase involved in cell wall biosynthesis